MSHNSEAIEKLNVLSTQDKMGHPQRVAEAPRKRSLGGLGRRLADWKAAPEVRVWTGPAFRALGVCGVLCCVAFLGKHSEKESMYGAPVALESNDSLKMGEVGQEPREPISEHSHADEPTAHTQTAPASPSPCLSADTPQKSGGITADGRIILNEASQNEFTQLRGVGDARAEAIVKLRERMGKFKSINDLLRIRGIGWKTLQALKDRLVVDRPKEQVPDAPVDKSSETKSAGEKSVSDKSPGDTSAGKRRADEKRAGEA